LEKKHKLDAEIKKLEEQTVELNQIRNDLFKQLSGMEKIIEDKVEERNELRAKVLVKQTALDQKQTELEDREKEVKQLRERLRQVQQKQ
jgi:chromosome segregation ATPase